MGTGQNCFRFEDRARFRCRNQNTGSIEGSDLHVFPGAKKRQITAVCAQSHAWSHGLGVYLRYSHESLLFLRGPAWHLARYKDSEQGQHSQIAPAVVYCDATFVLHAACGRWLMVGST